MIFYSWRSIKNNIRSSLLIYISFVAIFIAAPLTLSALFNIQANVEDTISDHARGSYDLIIRPIGSKTKIEEHLGKVEENYLTYGEGGISIQEWEDIKNLTDVEIAAPVASLGYFTGEGKTLSLDYPSASSYIEMEFSTFDGVNDYTLSDDPGFFYMLEQQGYAEGFDFYDETDDPFRVEGMKPEFTIPRTYHLTVGIDQEQEEKLTGIDLSALQNPIPQNLLDFNEADRDIPIIYLSDSYIPLEGETYVTNLEWDSQKTKALKKEFNIQESEPFFYSEQFYSLPEILSNVKRQSTDEYKVPLFEFMKPFYYEPLSFNYDGTFSEEVNFSIGIGESSKFYNTKPIEYEVIDDEILKVEKVGEDLGVPIYRDIVEQGKTTYELFEEGIEDVPFLLYPVGSFSTVEYQDTLASSPLGIYQQSPSVTLKENINLRETITPGSFVNSPAHGIMSLEDAAFIKGDRPIDAIRLKVAGITTYNKDAEEKIKKMIATISSISDFDITVVAGASPSPVTLDVEGVGEVEQSWTSLGAATEITKGWNTTNQTISIVFIIICFLYVINQGIFRKYAKTNEDILLKNLGWTNRLIKRFHLLEYCILIIFSAVTSCIALGLLSFSNVTNQSTWYLLLVIFASVVLITFCNITFTKQKSINHFNGTKFSRIWLRNLSFYKNLLSISVLQIMCATLLINFILIMLYQTRFATGGTNIGDHINNITIPLVLIVLIATLYLVIVNIIENISSFLLIREEEILTLRDIGWRLQEVRKVLIKEASAWIFPSIIIGMLLNFLVLQILSNISTNIIIISSFITLTLIGISFIVTVRIIKKTLMAI